MNTPAAQQVDADDDEQLLGAIDDDIQRVMIEKQWLERNARV